MTIRLLLPCHDYEQSYREYIAELGTEERYPFTLDFEYSDFSTLLKRIDDFANGINIPEGYVPSSTYWLIKGQELIGVSNLRLHLNDRIRHCGGHIGLGIRPSYRGCGLGSRLLALTVNEARKKDISEIHIHCYKNNEASARMIIRNGGELDSEIAYGNHAEVVQRYVLFAGNTLFK
jgi:predicted acetyltransferase